MPEHWPLSQHAAMKPPAMNAPPALHRKATIRLPWLRQLLLAGWQHGEHGEDKLALSPVRTACTPSECVPTDTLACTCGSTVHMAVQRMQALPTTRNSSSMILGDAESKTHRVRLRHLPSCEHSPPRKATTASRSSHYPHFHSPTTVGSSLSGVAPILQASPPRPTKEPHPRVGHRARHAQRPIAAGSLFSPDSDALNSYPNNRSVAVWHAQTRRIGGVLA